MTRRFAAPGIAVAWRMYESTACFGCTLKGVASALTSPGSSTSTAAPSLCSVATVFACPRFTVRLKFLPASRSCSEDDHEALLKLYVTCSTVITS